MRTLVALSSEELVQVKAGNNVLDTVTRLITGTSVTVNTTAVTDILTTITTTS